MLISINIKSVYGYAAIMMTTMLLITRFDVILFSKRINQL